MIAWSWSRLDCFEKCPKQFYHKNIKKDFKDDGDNPAFIKGNRIHAKLENGLKSGVVDPEVKDLSHTIHSLRGVEWEYKGVEDDYAFTDTLQKTKWNDWKNCWVRIKMDFIGIKDGVAVVIDWKTGKNRGYSEQLDLYAAAAFQAHDDVKEVRVSSRLTESPACLVVGDYDMSQNMARVLKQIGQDAPMPTPILEINVEHPLLDRMDNESDEDRFKDMAKLVFDQALLAEGGQLEDPASFVHNMNKLMLDMAK